MWSYFKFEFKQFITSKKNLAIYFLLLCMSCYYAISIAPNYEPIENADIDVIKASYETKGDFIKRFEDGEYLAPESFMAYDIYKYWNELDGKRIEAYEADDFPAFAETTAEWYIYADSQINSNSNLYYNSRYYNFGNTYAKEDGHYGYLYSASRYTDYAYGDSKLSINVFEERTVLQTLQRLFESYLPYVLLLGCILLAIDIVLKDRKNPTVMRGFPISMWQKLLGKGSVAFIGSLLMFVPLAVGLIIIGIRYGFGEFQLPVPIYSLTEQNFYNITMGNYLFQNVRLISCWFLLLISLILFLSIVIKVEFANLIAGVALILWEYFYYYRGLGFVKDVHWYPSTYTKVGQVISGYRNFLYNTEGISLENGMMLLRSCAIVLLVLTLIISSFKKYKLF